MDEPIRKFPQDLLYDEVVSVKGIKGRLERLPVRLSDDRIQLVVRDVVTRQVYNLTIPDNTLLVVHYGTR